MSFAVRNINGYRIGLASNFEELVASSKAVKRSTLTHPGQLIAKQGLGGLGLGLGNRGMLFKHSVPIFVHCYFGLRNDHVSKHCTSLASLRGPYKVAMAIHERWSSSRRDRASLLLYEHLFYRTHRASLLTRKTWP